MSMKANFVALLGIFFGVVNLIFAAINYVKVNQLYDDPTDKSALKNLKDIRNFAFSTIVIFSISLLTLILAYPKAIQPVVATA